DMQLLNEAAWDPRKMDSEVLSLFACPLIYSDGLGNGVKADKVVAVLFADSTELAAFGEETVKKIVAACEEFGRYVHGIAQRQARGEAAELISVKWQATSYPSDSKAGGLFEE